MYYKIVETDCQRGPFFNAFADLYEQLDSVPFPTVLGQGLRPGTLLAPRALAALPSGIQPYIDAVYDFVQEPTPNVTMQPIDWRCDAPPSQRVAVAFSSGKDSVAAALALRDKMDVTLFHVHGVNPCYGYELEYVHRAAKALGLPLVVRNIKVSGKGSPYKSPPVLNQLILAAMVEWAAPLGITNFCFGSSSHADDPTYKDDISPLYCLADYYGLYAALTPFYRQYMPAFNMVFPVQTETEAYATIHKIQPSILKNFDYASCVAAAYRKPGYRKNNMRRFGIELEASRCGTCNKCAYEYLHMVLYGIMPYIRTYAEYCIDRLHKATAQDSYVPGKAYTVSEAIDLYVDYAFLIKWFPVWADFDPVFDDFLTYLERHVAAGCPSSSDTQFWLEVFNGRQ